MPRFVRECEFCLLDNKNKAQVRCWWGQDCYLWDVAEYAEHWACLPCAQTQFIDQELLDETPGVNWELIDN